ncbi:MAG: hypothetical protein U5M51_06970 [Emticicia sp.]|nr:hypothetical protein [Emticicia sp.]
MTTDIQSHKMIFIQEYLRLNDEQIINKLSNLLHQEKSKKLDVELKPMTQNDFLAKLEKSEIDISTGNIYGQQEVEAFFKNRAK